MGGVVVENGVDEFAGRDVSLQCVECCEGHPRVINKQSGEINPPCPR
jgi:hypothetical protein